MLKPCFPAKSCELAPDELKALLSLNPAGKSQYVEYEADSNLKDFENIPLKENLLSYVLREVCPYVADAWIDRDTLDEQDGGIGQGGFEINFNREFFSTCRRGRWPKSTPNWRRWKRIIALLRR
ncbi:MAG: hypothetical protein R3F40_13940 [Candidatus Competibacteraceae bacterium]